MAEHKHTSVATYVLVALILGVITYVEFAIVEYDLAWLSSAAVLWILIVLSIAKFIMVVLYFMHLKGDDAMYQGFFASGMLFALVTFTALAFLFTLPSSFNFVRGQFTPPVEAEHAEEHGGLDEATRTLIDSDGYSRELTARLDAPPPRDQNFQVEVPEAPAAEYAVQDDTDPSSGRAVEEAGPGEEDAGTASEETVGDGAEGWDQALGEETYASNCASCHQANGAGVPGAFPPLADHAAELAQLEGGHQYLVDVLLYGLQGPIEVEGQTYDGVMPSWGQLDDEAIAAVLNHVVFAFETGAEAADVALFTADEVAAQRDAGLSPQDVHQEREALDLP